MTVLAGAIFSVLLIAPPGDKVIDVRSRQAPAASSFDALWAAYKKAESKGDNEGAQNALREIRRLRIERNIRSLETVALARVADGVAALARRRERARGDGAPRRRRPRSASAGRVLRPRAVRRQEGAPRHRARGEGHPRRDDGAPPHRAGRTLPLRARRARRAPRAAREHDRLRPGHAACATASLLHHDFEESFGPGRQRSPSASPPSSCSSPPCSSRAGPGCPCGGWPCCSCTWAGPSGSWP